MPVRGRWQTCRMTFKHQLNTNEMKKKEKKQVSQVIYTKDGLISILGVDKYNELERNKEFGEADHHPQGSGYMLVFREERFSKIALQALEASSFIPQKR